MKKASYNRTGWLHIATKGIRFKPDREAAERELREHIEDKKADLTRIFPGITEAEAEERALEGMGDPEEIGKELAKIHKPWLGYLWKASRAAVVLILMVSAFCWGGRMKERFQDWWEYERQGPGYGQYVNDCYHLGVDPFGPDSPYYDENAPKDLVRTPLLVTEPEESTRAGDYRFQVERAALWSFREVDSGEEDWWLFCDLRVDGPPWQPISSYTASHIRAVDSLGNRYYSSYEIYDLRMAPEEEDYVYVMTNGNGGGFAHERFRLQMSQMEPGAEWIRLEFDEGGPAWSLTIPLTEVAP